MPRHALRSLVRGLSAAIDGGRRWSLERRASVCKAGRHWLRHEGPAVVFVVCLASVLHHSHLLGPVGSLSILIASNLQAVGEFKPPDVMSAQAMVEVIDQKRFLQVYRERTPLNRCLLDADLAVIERSHPRVIAIDLDLSPVPGADATEKACQARLDTRIAGAPRPAGSVTIDDSQGTAPSLPSDRPRYVLIEPAVRDLPKAARDDGIDRATNKAWLQQYDRAGVMTASSLLQLSLNTVITSECDCGMLAETVYDALHGRGAACRGFPGSRIIDYRGFMNQVRVEPVERAASDGLPSGHTVFFGGAYGVGDLHQTPIGPLFGVEIHAARFFSVHSSEEGGELASFMIDLAIASIFSGLSIVAMNAYVRLAKNPSYWYAQRRLLVMAAFVLTFVGLQVAALYLCASLLARGVWIEPLLISLGVTIDAFLVTPWRQLAHGSPKHVEPSTRFRIVGALRSDWLGALCHLVAVIVFWSVVAAEVKLTMSSVFIPR
jgi:hypothetical protein